MVHIYETITTIIRDALRMEGVEKAPDSEIEKLFGTELVEKGKIPTKFQRILKDVFKAKKDYDQKKLTKAEVEKVRKDSSGFIKVIVEYMQRKRGRELEKTGIRLKHGEKYGEVVLLGDTAYVVDDIDAADKTIQKAKIKTDGSLGPLQNSSLEEMEEDLAKIRIPDKVFIKQPIFEDLEKIFGKDVEVQVNL
jgi:hypothetical protein